MKYLKIFDKENVLSYKEAINSLNTYHYNVEKDIIIFKDKYGKKCAIIGDRVVRGISFENSKLEWRVAFLNETGVKFIRKECIF